MKTNRAATQCIAMMQWDDLSGAIAKGAAAVSNEQCNARQCYVIVIAKLLVILFFQNQLHSFKPPMYYQAKVSINILKLISFCPKPRYCALELYFQANSSIVSEKKNQFEM